MRTIIIKMWDHADDPLSVMTTLPIRNHIEVDERVSKKVIRKHLEEAFRKMLDFWEGKQP